MEDSEVLASIEQLVGEEDGLWAHASDGHGMAESEKHRLQEVQVQLDQCWDLLRQRQARRQYGMDPDEATVRSADTVEHYTG